MTVRNMREADLDRVCQIEEATFSVPWSRESIKKEICENEQAHYLIAEEDGEIAGYGGFWQVLDEGHIMNIAVDEKWRQRGIGETLLREMIAQGKQLGVLYWTLEVRVTNRAAISLYEKIGFSSAGIRPGYYEKPKENAYIMWYQAD